MSDVTLPATGQKVATELEADGSHVQVVAAIIERSAMMFAAQFLQNIAPFYEAGVLVRPGSGSFSIAGSVNVATNVAPASFGFTEAQGRSESDIWYQNIRSNVA